jgi:hypothetical protein
MDVTGLRFSIVQYFLLRPPIEDDLFIKYFCKIGQFVGVIFCCCLDDPFEFSFDSNQDDFVLGHDYYEKFFRNFGAICRDVYSDRFIFIPNQHHRFEAISFHARIDAA